MTRALLAALTLTLALLSAAPAADVEHDVYSVGVAEVDITPAHPIRLNGFGFRRAESEGVEHPIHARALAIRFKDGEPLVLMTIDMLGLPDHHRAELVRRLQGKVKSERLAVTATHTHCGPMLSGANPTLFGVPIPAEHLERIDKYTAVFLDKLEQAALAALKDMKPAKLSWGVGSVGFAKNRRTPGGPTDHDLPVLVVRDAATNRVRAVYTSYACHCVTLSHNKIGGDWAGFAAEAIRDRFPGAVGLVSIGCGADQNPDTGVTGDKVDAAKAQGRMIADEVKRLGGGFLAPVQGEPVCTLKSVDLPLADLPDRAGWEEKAKRQDAVGHHAQVQLAKLDRKEALRTSITYPVQTWTFGKSLAMVHLPGEVVVDYANRLKKELDRGRLWVTAYANTNPCYIPSERVLKEGGYEGGGAMVYYDVPVPFKPGLEQPIVAEVKTQLGERFKAAVDPDRTGGTRPLAPAQSQALIRVGDRFAVDLVAAEPLVADPVALGFGPDGKLWVAEMLDYPSGPGGKFEPGGRVRVVTDADGDGTFDTATTFLDGLPFPTGVLPWRKGVLICAAPDILYAEDADGDGKADKVEKLFSGFGTDNYQARVNGLAYGLDGWVYGSCGLFGGKIVSSRAGKTYTLGDRDFRIRPDSGELEPATGRTQQGRMRDDWGNWFGCDNSNLAWHYPLADHDLRRNPFVVPPRGNVHVPAGPDPNRLFPVRSPQLFALSGPAGRTTGACGLGVYRDGLLGEDLAGNLFTCEPVNLLVTRRVPKPNGSTFTGTRADDEVEREFFASADQWSRPVQAITGPDGGLWVADMYRFVIEHPRWIPPADLAKLDLRAGAGLGRIYRVRPKETPVRAWPRLDKLDAAGLVAALDSPNGWQRDMATELLAWRGEKAAVPLLVKQAAEGKRPETRLHALASLDRLGGLDVGLVGAALKDAHPGVRRHAVRLAEPYLDMLGPDVARLAEDADAQVRLQVAATLGGWKDARAGEALARVALHEKGDVYLVAAVVASLNKENFRGFVDRLDVADLGGTPLLPQLIATAIGLGDDAVMTPLLERVGKPIDGKFQPWQLAATETILDAWDRLGKGKARPKVVAEVVNAARTIATSPGDAGARAAAVRLLGRDTDRRGDDLAALAGLLVPQTPPSVQSAVIAALGRTGDDKAAEALIAGWKGYSPSLQAQVAGALFARPAWLKAVLVALEDGRLPTAAVDAPQRHRLLTHADVTTRARAEKLFAGATNADRQQVIAAYRKEPRPAGDATRGKQVFAKACAACHHLDGVGNKVGPDLAALANKSADYLLAEILDPNRNLDTRYVEYLAYTSDGRALAGLLASETTTAIRLLKADGKEVGLLRADLESLTSSGRSLMPEGLEKDLPPEAMADLLAYLAGTARPPKASAGNVPKLVRPVDGRLTLRAAECELHGSDVVFEREFGNVGMWHGPKDHVVWRVRLDAAGEYDVHLDFACDAGSAGNAWALDGGEPTLRGSVASTGTWANYQQVKLGTVKLPAGDIRLTFRPDADRLKGALIDLRTLVLVPKGQPVRFGQATPDDPKVIAAILLDDSKPQAERVTLAARHADKAAALVREMTVDLAPGKEEYRRIPWIWRVSIAAGKRNDAGQLRALLDASLPKKGEPLRDWQAVVLGGGVINGIGLEHGWPEPAVKKLLGTDAALTERWQAALVAAQKMADDAKAPAGTRYDALRMVALLGWEKAGKQLTRYLAKGTDAELQQGAVSGLVDLDAAEATRALVPALSHLTDANRKFALEGLLRSEARANALLDAVEKGDVKADTVGATVRQALANHKSEAVRQRAGRLLGR